MTDTLITRGNGVNSPRYQNFISPPYTAQLKDDTGASISLVGASTSGMTFTLQRFSDGLVITGRGRWTITDAANGHVSYQYAASDVASTGAFGVYVTVQLSGEAGPRAFDPDFIIIYPWNGGTTILSTQDVNLIEINGTAISTSNPVPTSAADGADVAQGSTTDAAWSGSGAGTQIAILKKIEALLAATLAISGSVSVSNFPGTQPVSAVSLPLPSGASTAAKQPALGTAGTASADVLSVQGIASMTALKTDGSGVTQPVSGTVTENQGGTWTVQPGNTANTTAWKVDGSAVTQPVSGTFWQATQPVSGTITASAGTNLNTSALALESGGHLANIDTHIPALGQATMASSSPVVIASNQSNVPTSLQAVAAGLSNANPVPVLNTAQTGYVTAFGSNPSALTANTDAAFKWGAGGTTQVNHVMIQNNSAVNASWDLDVATTAGSPILIPGQTIFLDVQTTAVHLQANGTPNLNGSTSSNIVVRGWL